MLIIEGADLVGKTTLCRKLVERLHGEGYIYKHFSRLPPVFDRYWGYRNNAVRQCVHDRFHMSEPVYCYARGEHSSLLTPEKYRLVDGYLRTMGAFTVVVSVNAADLLKRRWREGEMYDFGVVERANYAFDEIIQHNGHFHFQGVDYAMDVDYAIRCTASSPYPRDQDIDNILTMYRARQDQLDTVIYRKPTPSCI